MALLIGLFALSTSPVLAYSRYTSGNSNSNCNRTAQNSYSWSRGGNCTSRGSYRVQNAWGTAYGSNSTRTQTNNPISITGTVSSVSYSMVTLEGTNGGFYTVYLSGAQVVQNGNPFSVSGIQIGDVLSVQGTMQGSNSVTATWISDSTQTQYGTMYGTITAWNGSSFDLLTNTNTSYVTLASAVTVTNNGASAATSNLSNGESVTISGTWSRTGNNFVAYSINITAGYNNGYNYNSNGYNYNNGYNYTNGNNYNSNNGYSCNGLSGYYYNGYSCVYNGYNYNQNTQTQPNSSVPGGQSSVSLSFAPYANNAQLTSGQSTTASISARDPYGISSVAIFVNGTQVQTCNQSGSPTSATCSYTLYAGNYTSGSSVSVYAHIVDQNGYVTDSNVQYFTIANYGTVTNNTNTTNSNNYASISLSPYVTTLTNGASTVITASGNDSNGISGINIIVNGVTIHACAQSYYPTTYTCTQTLYGNNYSYGSTVSVYAQVLDRNGYTYSSNVQNITIN